MKFLGVYSEDDVRVSLSDDLADALGFQRGRKYWYYNENEPFILSDNTADVEQGFTSLYVYCSLCENRLVGDASVRLLRVIPVRSEGERNVYEEVRTPHYVPVTNTSSDVVEINISRDDGKPVPFKGGKVIVTLHLRKRTPSS